MPSTAQPPAIDLSESSSDISPASAAGPSNQAMGNAGNAFAVEDATLDGNVTGRLGLNDVALLLKTADFAATVSGFTIRCIAL